MGRVAASIVNAYEVSWEAVKAATVFYIGDVKRKRFILYDVVLDCLIVYWVLVILGICPMMPPFLFYLF